MNTFLVSRILIASKISYIAAASDQVVRVTSNGKASNWPLPVFVMSVLNPFPALIKSEYSHILFKKFITHEPYIKNTCNKVPQVEPDLSHSWNHHCCLATNHHPTNNNC